MFESSVAPSYIKSKKVRGRRGGAQRTYGQQLLDEYHGYYSRYPANRAGEIVDPLHDAQEQRWRKADWRAKKAREVKERAQHARERS